MSSISSLRSSPIPDLAYDSCRSLSLREQTLIKRQQHQQHNQQPNLGHEPSLSRSESHSHSPQPTSNTYNRHITKSRSNPNGQMGVPGNGTYQPGKFVNPLSPHHVFANGTSYSLSKYSGEAMAFWVLLSILAILAIVNALLTFIIFGVLRLGAGMESIEFLPKILKFYGLTDLDEIFKRDGLLEALPNQPMEFTGEDGDLHFHIAAGVQPSLSVDRNVINITQVSEFRVVDKKGREVFSTNTPTLGLPKGIKSLDVRLVKATKVTSAVNSTLHMRSTTFAYLKGAEGTHINGKQIVLAADQDIFLKSVNGNIILTGKNGLLLDVNALPLVKEDGVTRKSYTYTTQGKKESQYQLCVCMPEGKLYKVQIPINNANLPPHKKIGCHSAVQQCK